MPGRCRACCETIRLQQWLVGRQADACMFRSVQGACSRLTVTYGSCSRSAFLGTLSRPNASSSCVISKGGSKACKKYKPV